MSSAQKKTRGRPSGNGARRAMDYVNVQYATEAIGARKHMAHIGGTQRVNPEPRVASKYKYNLSSSLDSLDGPLVTSRSRQRKERGTKSKTRRQLSATLLDSDSSSMDGLSMTSEMIEQRALEEEHYNKLKLNVNHMDNKRVQKGVNVLYADKFNGEIGFRHRTPSGSRMTRPHAVPHQVLHQQPLTQGRGLTKSPLLIVKKEGHGNRLHSVSGRPVPRSTSILWKKSTMTKSFSTGDMLGIAREGTDGQQGSEKAIVRRTQSFSESTHTTVDKRMAQAASMAATSKKVQQARHYENVEPAAAIKVQVEPPEETVRLRRSKECGRRDEHSRQRHSVLRNSSSQSAEGLHRLSEATTESYSSSVYTRKSPTPYLSPKKSPLRHLEIEMKQARLSPRASPVDMKRAPLSPLLQPATLHNDSCPITCSCHGIHFIDPIVTIPCDSNGGEYMSEAHDFKILIPKGVIKKRTTVELQIGVTLQGPFQTPQSTNIVSPIVWVGLRPDTKLKKPIEIKLPHFLDLSHSSQKREMFLKASDKMANSSKARCSARKYSFKETSESQGVYQEGHGILLTKSLGFFCIATSQFSKQHASCCLLPIIPKPVQSNTWKIHYCVTYLLKSCIQLVQQQFGGDWEILPPRTFKFEGDGNEGALEIQFERQLLEAGWILALESSNKILASEVELWSNKEGTRISDSISSFPPRFTIRVHGGEARMSSMAQIKFTGCSEIMSSEIVLPLRPVYSQGDLSCTPLSTPTSSVFSPQHISVGSSQDSNFPITSTVLPQTTKLGWQCHSQSCMCDECSRDYDHLPSLEELGQTHLQLTYHNGHIDLPTDEDLKNIATKVARCLQGDWTTLQATLDIPDFIMLDVLSQRSIDLQVYRLLKEWRNHTKDCSKDKLAQCLAKADQRLQAVSNDLLSSSK